MAYQKKQWKNRVSDYPTRRLITPVGQGDAFVAEIERNEGTITEEGDPFNAATMNDLETRIEAGIGAGSAAIAPEEASSTASRAYSVNQFLIYDGKFYKVIATIPQGATLVPGTNIQEDTVGAELTYSIAADASHSQSINGINGQLTYGAYKFYLDYQNGNWGWNSSPARGADTFHPFRTSGYSMAQNITTSLYVPHDRTGGGTITFNQLSRIDGFLYIEVLTDGRLNISTFRTSGNTLTIEGFNDAFVDGYIQVNATAFQF